MSQPFTEIVPGDLPGEVPDDPDRAEKERQEREEKERASIKIQARARGIIDRRKSREFQALGRVFAYVTSGSRASSKQAAEQKAKEEAEAEERERKQAEEKKAQEEAARRLKEAADLKEQARIQNEEAERRLKEIEEQARKQREAAELEKRNKEDERRQKEASLHEQARIRKEDKDTADNRAAQEKAIKDAALQETRIEVSAEGLAGIWSCNAGKSNYELVFLDKAGLRFMEKKSRAEGRLEPSSGWWVGDVKVDDSKVGVIRLQKKKDGNMISQFKRKLEDTWGTPTIAFKAEHLQRVSSEAVTKMTIWYEGAKSVSGFGRNEKGKFTVGGIGIAKDYLYLTATNLYGQFKFQLTWDESLQAYNGEIQGPGYEGEQCKCNFVQGSTKQKDALENATDHSDGEAERNSDLDSDSDPDSDEEDDTDTSRKYNAARRVGKAEKEYEKLEREKMEKLKELKETQRMFEKQLYDKQEEAKSKVDEKIKKELAALELEEEEKLISMRNDAEQSKQEDQRNLEKMSEHLAKEELAVADLRKKSAEKKSMLEKQEREARLRFHDVKHEFDMKKDAALKGDNREEVARIEAMLEEEKQKFAEKEKAWLEKIEEDNRDLAEAEARIEEARKKLQKETEDAEARALTATEAIENARLEQARKRQEKTQQVQEAHKEELSKIKLEFEQYIKAEEAKGKQKIQDIEEKQKTVTEKDKEELQKKKTSSAMKTVLGSVAGFFLEITMACLFSAVLPREYGIISWVSLGFFLIFRSLLFIFLAGGYCAPTYFDMPHQLLEKYPKRIMVVVVITIAGPSTLLLGMSIWGVVKDCAIDLETKEVRSYTRSDVATYLESEITCYNEAAPTLFQFPHQGFLSQFLTAFFPSVIKIVTPLVFAYVITDGLGNLILLALLEDAKNAKLAETVILPLLQLTVLDFADVTGFAALSWKVSAHAYLSNLNLWFWVSLSMLFVCYLATWTEVVYLMQEAMRILSPKQDKKAKDEKKHLKETYERVFAIISLFIDIPLGFFRCYMVFCRVRIDRIYLVKNLFCALYEIAVLGNIVSLKSFLQQVLSMLPGGGTMTERFKDAKNTNKLAGNRESMNKGSKEDLTDALKGHEGGLLKLQDVGTAPTPLLE